MPARFEHDRDAHTGCPLYYKHVAPPSRSPTPVKPPALLIGADARDLLDDADAKFVIGDVADDTEKRALMRARVGQGKYRESLIDRWVTCSVLGCGPATILIASHIVPWCKCATNAERIDPFNGLLLTPNLDKLFDRGLITFDVNGKIRISTLLPSSDAASLAIHTGLKLRAVPDETKAYLERHVSEGHFKP